jgi:hypothetical protein
VGLAPNSAGHDTKAIDDIVKRWDASALFLDDGRDLQTARPWKSVRMEGERFPPRRLLRDIAAAVQCRIDRGRGGGADGQIRRI